MKTGRSAGSGASWSREGDAGGRAPGKRTLTESLPIQRKAEKAPGTADPGAAFEQATSGPVAQVPHRAKMESAFGVDFGGVRAHLGGAQARDGLADLGAMAATSGDRIAFKDPAPSESLVAHELAHVVQQGRGGGGVQAKATSVSQPSDDAEARADAAAHAVVNGLPMPDVGTAAGGSIHRALETNGGTWDTKR